MRKFVLGSVVLALAATVWAAPEEKKIDGVLIDQACGSKCMTKDDPQAAAEKHPMACCLKPACEKSGFEIISGKDEMKINTDSTGKVKEYLEKDGNSTKVDATYTSNADGTITIVNIDPQKS